LRGLAGLCILASVVLLVPSLALATRSTPTKRRLPTGIVFNVPAAKAQAPIELPPPSPTEAPPTNAPTTEPTEAPTAQPTPPPSEAPIARLVIPRIKVDAPISVKGLDANGGMQEPNGRSDVAYYDFTGRPGFGTGNNVVFAGHLDYYPHDTAVFWDLDKLKAGDEIHVHLQDGTDYTYRVTQMVAYAASAAPVDAITGPTETESVTLITCNGTFAGGHYNDRLVVRAERVT
jgi:LPXTG-site transpeptidase (sortase) family protein